jgi:hypothetical protein
MMDKNERQLAGLVNWLRALPHIGKVEPVLVIIGGYRFYGAVYDQLSAEDADVASAGKIAAPELPSLFSSVRFYLLGIPPRTMSGRVFDHCVLTYTCAFPSRGLSNGTGEWFRVCYWASKANEHHPFGPNFIVMEYRVPLEMPELAIPFFSASEPRIKMTVRVLKSKALRKAIYGDLV